MPSPPPPTVPPDVSIASLPIPLLLLVHLHILEYPHANSPEYDHNIFNPRTRGLRERAKTMEDVAFFLVGKIELKAKNGKSILPTYPCSQPSESLAFRTSLTKYLENLRHQSIYSTSSGGTSNSAAGSTKNKKFSSSENAGSVVALSLNEAAWWWKDVVVRKSLLEECSGDKFERLILSLSTHALMKSSRHIHTPDKLTTILHSQPMIYTACLARYQTTRQEWTKTASLLTKEERDLDVIRDSLNNGVDSKYPSLPTERLQALVESKFHALLTATWQRRKDALFRFIKLSGLKVKESSLYQPKGEDDTHDTVLKPPVLGVGANLNSLSSSVSASSFSQPQPLPVAAAHHPAYLKRLKRPVFQPKPPSHSATQFPSNDGCNKPHKSHAEIVLTQQLDAEKRMRVMLSDALARVETKRVKLDGALAKSAVRSTAGTIYTSDTFWTPPPLSPGLDLEPKVTKELMVSVGLEKEYELVTFGVDDVDNKEHDQEDPMEKRIHEIRNIILPPYPVAPDPHAPRIMPQVNQVDIDDAKAKSQQHKPPGPALRPKAVPLPPNASAPSRYLQIPSTPLPPISPGKSSTSIARSIRRKSVRLSSVKRRALPGGRLSLFRVFSGEDEVNRLVDETHDFPTDDEDTDTESQSEGPFPSSFKTPKLQFKGRPRPAINRIWTAGTPLNLSSSTANSTIISYSSNVDGRKNSYENGMETPKPNHRQKDRVSSSELAALFDMEPKVGLPRLSLGLSEEGSFSEEDGDSVFAPRYAGADAMDDEDQPENVYRPGTQDVNATPRAVRQPLPTSPSSSIPAFQLTSSDDDDVVGVEEGDDAFSDDPPSMTLKDILLSADLSHFDLLELSSEDIGEGMLFEDTSFVWE